MTWAIERVADAICDRLDAGESVRSIASDYDLSEWAVELIWAARNGSADTPQTVVQEER